MSETVTLHFPFAPIGKGRPRISTRGGFVRNITPEKTRAYEKAIADSARVQLGMRFEPWTGPVALAASFYMPIPKRMKCPDPDNVRARMAMFHAKKPDMSNILKALEDALNGILWVDDSQIAHANIGKRYSTSPRIEVQATQLT